MFGGAVLGVAVEGIAAAGAGECMGTRVRVTSTGGGKGVAEKAGAGLPPLGGGSAPVGDSCAGYASSRSFVGDGGSEGGEEGARV